MARISALYRIEAEIRGLSAAERRAAPRSLLISAYGSRCSIRSCSSAARPPTPSGYALNHWEGLFRFLEAGRIEIDTNTVERSMRPIAVSRKNALFAGSNEGAVNWAAVSSLVKTCKLNAVDPRRYLDDTLTRLVKDGLSLV